MSAPGGEVRITAAQAMRVGTIEVEAYDDPATLDRVFRARAIR